MRTAERCTPRGDAREARSRGLSRLGPSLCGLLALTATACALPHDLDLVELQRDHEQCLSGAQQAPAAVRYDDYQDCMLRHGWSDAELGSGTG